MDAASWAAIATIVVSVLLGLLTIRATRRSTADTRAAAELEARDRIIEQRDRDIEARDRTIDQRDRLLEWLQGERDRLAVIAGQRENDCSAQEATIHDLEVQVARLRTES